MVENALSASALIVVSSHITIIMIVTVCERVWEVDAHIRLMTVYEFCHLQVSQRNAEADNSQVQLGGYIHV